MSNSDMSDRELLARIDTRLFSVECRLFGDDGIEGELPALKNRVQTLETYKNRQSGVLEALKWIVSFLGLSEVYRLFKH